MFKYECKNRNMLFCTSWQLKAIISAESYELTTGKASDVRKDSKRATNLFSPLQVHLVNRSVFSLTLSISSFIHWVLVLHFMKVVHWPFLIMLSQQLLPQFTSLLKSIQMNCGWLSLTLGAWWPIFSVTETSSITLSLVVGKWQLCPIMTRSLLLLLLLPGWPHSLLHHPTSRQLVKEQHEI